MMKATTALRRPVVAVALGVLSGGTALAQTTPAAPAAEPPKAAEPAKPEPDFTFASNVGIFSQYVFRGVTQTNEKPAVQGGFDLSHKSGLYVGTWLSNVSWISDFTPGVSASLEWDMYGGFKNAFPGDFKDFGYDLGVLYYYYPGTYPSGFTKPNTTELYGSLSWTFSPDNNGSVYAKYSYSANNQTFGIPDSRGSGYFDVTATYDIVQKVNDVIGKVTIFGHYGHQSYRNNSVLSYDDWKYGGSFDLLGLTVGLYGTNTNANSAPYTNIYGKNTAASQFVAYVQKTF